MPLLRTVLLHDQMVRTVVSVWRMEAVDPTAMTSTVAPTLMPKEHHKGRQKWPAHLLFGMLLPGGILGLRTRPTTHNRLPASPRTSKSVRYSLPTIPPFMSIFYEPLFGLGHYFSVALCRLESRVSAFTFTLYGHPTMYLILLPRNEQFCALDTSFTQLLHIWRLVLIPRSWALLYLPSSHQRMFSETCVIFCLGFSGL